MSALLDELVGMQNVQARHVLGLFADSFFGKSELSKLESPILLGTEKVDGTTCQKLMAKESHRWIVFLWIQGKSKLVHRIETRDLGNGNPVWLTITLKPTANKKVSDKQLAFE
ncbi:MAG: hypothetical protein IPK83_13670 [Planctomycetes bacterium]|nr:hypothetical protein [Planctomycetota bacterium]